MDPSGHDPGGFFRLYRKMIMDYTIHWLSDQEWFVEDCDDYNTAREAVEKNVYQHFKGNPPKIFMTTRHLAEVNYTIANDYYFDDAAKLKKVSLDGTPDGDEAIALMQGVYLR